MAWWDRLGLACLASAVSVASVMGVLGLCQRLGLLGRFAQPWGTILTALSVGLLMTYMATAVHRLARAVVHRNEVVLDEVARVPARDFVQALGLVVTQVAVSAICLGNMWFYVAWRSTVGAFLAVVFGYLFALWLLNSLYHWPLLTAAQEGLIPPAEGSSGPSLRHVLRNGFVLFLGAPAYTAGLALVMLLTMLVLSATGIGLVLAVPALWAILGTQALHDHMVRLGMLPPPDEGPVTQDDWRVPND